MKHSQPRHSFFKIQYGGEPLPRAAVDFYRQVVIEEGRNLQRAGR